MNVDRISSEGNLDELDDEIGDEDLKLSLAHRLKDPKVFGLL
jgi:hypothetical protein